MLSIVSPRGKSRMLLSLKVSKVSLENFQLNQKSLVQDGWQVNGESALFTNDSSWSNRKMEGVFTPALWDVTSVRFLCLRPEGRGLWSLSVWVQHRKRGLWLYVPLSYRASIHQYAKGIGAMPMAYQTLGRLVSAAEQVDLLQLLSLLPLNKETWKRTKGNHLIQSLHVMESFA